MDASTIALALNLSAALCAGAAFLGLLAIAPAVGRFLHGLAPTAMERVGAPGVRFGFAASETIGLVAVIAVAAYAAAMGGLAPVLLALAPMAALVAPLLTEQMARKAEARRLEIVFPGVLQQVSNEMASGRSLEGALDAVAESAPPPADAELMGLRRKLGVLGLDAALDETARRLNSEGFSLMASVIKVGARRGGNLIMALKRLSSTLYELERLKQELRTASENARRVLAFQSVAAFVLPIGYYAISPGELERAWQSPVGQGMLIMAGVAFVSSLMVVRWMLKIKV